MSIGRKWKEIIDITDKITYNFHVSFLLFANMNAFMSIVCVLVSLTALVITG